MKTAITYSTGEKKNKQKKRHADNRLLFGKNIK